MPIDRESLIAKKKEIENKKEEEIKIQNETPSSDK
jgi:hypothetical protein